MDVRKFEWFLNFELQNAKKGFQKGKSINNFLECFGRIFKRCTNEFEESTVIERFAEVFKEEMVA